MPIPGALIATPPVFVYGERPTFTWDGVDGSTWALGDGSDGSPIILMPGMTGLDMPPVSSFLDATPQLAGARYGGSHADPRPVFLPLYVEGGSRAAAVDVRRAFLNSLAPFSGQAGTLTVAEPDGTRRHLDCRYVGGAEGSEGTDESGLHWITYGINLIADDQPFWYGDPITPPSWSASTPPAFFPLRAFPFVVGSSQVLGATSVFNAGDVDAYPVWTLNGPATGLTLTLGARTLALTHTITAGQQIIVDTHPRAETIVDQTGASLWAGVAAGYDLWPLPPGVSPITITVTGTGTGTNLSMTYSPLYLKA